MKTILCFFAAVIILLPALSNADSPWTWTEVQNNILLREIVSTPDHDYVYAAGYTHGAPGYKTSDGYNFEAIAMAMPFTLCLYFDGSNSGYSFGSTSQPNGFYGIDKTENGANSWININPNSGSIYWPTQFTKIRNTYYLVGQYTPYVEYSGLKKSTDGFNWSYDSPGESIMGIAEGTDGIYVCAGHYTSPLRFMFKSFNGGGWQELSSIPAPMTYLAYKNVNARLMKNGKSVVFMGGGKQLLRYREDDQSFLYTPFANNILTMEFKNEDEGYLVANDSNGCTVYETTDGGNAWSIIGAFSEQVGERSCLGVLNDRVLIYLSNHNVYLGRTSITGIINQGVPNVFSLDQNYPNPFNPSTLIQYQIPKQSHVSIKVFDMSGKELASLVNKVEKAGTHEVTFNAEKYSSGVYFYRIFTEGFTETKKMILVK